MTASIKRISTHQTAIQKMQSNNLFYIQHYLEVQTNITYQSISKLIKNRILKHNDIGDNGVQIQYRSLSQMSV